MPISAEGIGGDSFPIIRCHRPAQRRFAHLPDHEGVGVDGSKRMFILLLDHFLQVAHRLNFSNVDGERVVGYVENPTKNCEVII